MATVKGSLHPDLDIMWQLGFVRRPILNSVWWLCLAAANLWWKH